MASLGPSELNASQVKFPVSLYTSVTNTCGVEKKNFDDLEYSTAI